MGAAFFGGLPATGTIARTATNVRAGAHGPVSGMLHALYVLLFMLLFAPLMAMIPLAALAGLLAIVAWNMVERHAIASLMRRHGADAVVLLATLFITVFRDLTEGILVGVLLGAILFAVRMAKLVEVTSGQSLMSEGREMPLPEGMDDDIVSLRISGPLFFGSSPQLGAVMGRIGVRPRFYLLDLAEVPLIDASGADAIETFAERVRGQGAEVVISGARPEITKALQAASDAPRPFVFADSWSEALAYARGMR
jgi:SulP family sulfate permease